MNFRPGKIKALVDRNLVTISKLNFPILAYLFIKDAGVHWWYLILIPVYLVWLWYDVKKVMPDEFDYLQRKSPFMRELSDNIKDIQKTIKP